MNNKLIKEKYELGKKLKKMEKILSSVSIDNLEGKDKDDINNFKEEIKLILFKNSSFAILYKIFI